MRTQRNELTVKFVLLTFELKTPASQLPFGAKFVKCGSWLLTLWYSHGFSGVCHLKGWEGGQDHPLPLPSRPIPASQTVPLADLAFLDAGSWNPAWRRGEISWGDVSLAAWVCNELPVSVEPSLPRSMLTKEAKVFRRDWSQLKAATWEKPSLRLPL